MRPTLDFHPALLEALRGYNASRLKQDVTAGIVVGIVALPLAIAFGIASGVNPSIGLVTAIIGGFLVSALGGNSVQIGGPTGAFIVIVYNIIQQFGLTGLALATFMAGCILILLGLFRLGTVIKFIPYPIVVGFTAGIALTIFSTQIPDLLGLSIQEKIPGDFISKWGVYFRNAASIDWATVLVSAATLMIIIAVPKISRRLPATLIAIVAVTFGCWLVGDIFGLIHVDTIGARFGARTNCNTELIGQGVANAVVPLFGGIPVTGAIARTMTNITSGGRTPVAGVVHAAVLLLIFFFAMPVINMVPMSCLAAVLVMDRSAARGGGLPAPCHGEYYSESIWPPA